MQYATPMGVLEGVGYLAPTRAISRKYRSSLSSESDEDLPRTGSFLQWAQPTPTVFDGPG